MAVLLSVVLVVCGMLVSLRAHAPSGAIFTTLSDGTEVNLNQFPSKEAVYLDGGPGPGAPQSAAGLDDGTYVFQVTDPSGQTLLSTDPARCRRFTVLNGVINGVVGAGGCEHATGFDVDHSATTVQLFPYLDTPNPGGVYKAWITPLQDFLDGCAALGIPAGLDVVDCGYAPGNRHGFAGGHTKTDNFKVSGDSVRQIDTLFFRDRNNNGHRDADEESIPSLSVTWTDTVGANNIRYADPEFQWGVYAHVEVPETDNGATHSITIPDQVGCRVGLVHINDFDAVRDAQGRVTIDVTGNYDYLIEVACRPGRGGPR
jgi:hypothetical protein